MKSKSIVVGAAVLLTMTGLAGCGGNTPLTSSQSPSSSVVSGTLSLNTNNVDLVLFSEFTLRATLTGSEEAIFFSSSDPSIVSVSETGILKALKIGNSVIKAKAGVLEQTCTVNVTYGTIKPTLTLNHENVDLFVGGKITMAATVSYNNNDVTPDSIEWTITGDVADITKNGLSCSLKATKFGSGVIKAKIVYASTTLEKQCTVNVKEDLSIEIAGGTLTDNNYETELISYIPEGYQTSLLTTYAPDIVVTKDGEKVANPILAVALREGEPEGVAIYENKVFKAVGKGQAIFDIKFIGQSGKVAALGLKVTVVGPSVALNGTFEFDLSKDIAVISEPIILGEPISAKVDGVDVGVIKEGNDIKLSGLSSLHYGLRKTMEIVTNKGVYSSTKVNLASLIISDKAELDQLADISKKAYSKDDYFGTESGFGGYFIFDNDITYDGTFAPFAGTDQGCGYWGQGFHGIVDGRGHVIKGLTIATQSGIFGVVSMNSTIKNLGFTNASLTSHGGYLSQLCYGNFENIYVNGKSTADPNGFVGTVCSEFLNPASLKNVVIELASGGSYGWGTVAGCGIITSAGTIENTFLVTSDAVRFTYSEDAKGPEALALAEKANLGKFSNRSEFIKNNIVLDSFDQTYWKTESGFPLYRGALADIEGAILLSKALDIDLSTNEVLVNDPMIKGEGIEATIDGTNCPVTNKEDGIHLSITGLKTGEGKTLLLKTKAGVYQNDNVTIATKVIVDKAGFDSIGAAAKSAYVAEDFANSIGGSAGYFVLGADINYDGVFKSWNGTAEGATYWGDGWHGTFDGRGHVIKGLEVSSGSGVFGVASIYSVIKNVGFTGAVLTTVGGFLTQLSYGKVSNVSIDLKTGGGSGFVGAFAGEFLPGASYSNVIARLAEGSAFGWGGVAGFGITKGSGEIKDTYLVVAGARFTYQEDSTIAGFVDTLNGCVYSDETSFKEAGRDFTSFSKDLWDTASGTPRYKASI